LCTSNEIGLKSISELLGMTFFIPSYQRGYRWDEQQVTDLLNDIRDFKTENDNWYCLQPLVVKKNKENNEWEVIDGQQRLTTVFLIIHYFNEMWEGKRKTNEPTIIYQTRKGSYQFLKDMKVEKVENDEYVKINDDNIDYHYISSAYEAINNWAIENEEKENFDRDKFRSKFKEQTKVIWYETDPKQDGRVIFSRINRGKIPLTNAELIKALFLNSSNFNTENSNDEKRIELKQLQIATEWDIMETELHNDEFWLFINKEENNKETRIEYLFELIVGKSGNTKDNYYTFREFSKDFKDNTEKTIEDNWKKIKRCFQTLKDWFDDRELYHKIGFLITLGEDIKTLVDESREKDKKSFTENIIDKIKSKFKDIQIDKIEYPDEKIRSILLMHNIQTMLNNEKENSRFPFNRYKREEWDIEHIHAIATRMPKKEQHQKDWLSQARKFIDKEKTDLLERLDNYSTETFEKLFNDILDYFDENGKHEDINDLSNLVLLDMGTNRGYKNAVFPYKRTTIIEKEKNGVFVPLCTRNVFTKSYSLEIKQITIWGEEDRNDYFNDILKVLSKYLPIPKDSKQ
jgi:uncharacterized protein with ParB-like and HNH nuclease domain/uncharacterized protein YejL (UPF0352 family)